MLDRVISAGALSDRRNNRCFRNIQFTDTLSKIPVGCRLNTQAVLPQVNGIQIALQNLRLRHDLFQLDRQILLLQLSLDLIQHAILRHEVKDIILQQLLGDRTCTLCSSESADYKFDSRTDHTLNINSIVIIESLILDGDKCFLHMLWNIIQFYIRTVGSFCHKLCRLVTVRIIDNGFITSWQYTGTGNVRCIFHNTFNNTDSAAQTGDAQRNDQHQQCLHKDDSQFLTHLGTFSFESLLFSGGAFLTVIHSLASFYSLNTSIAFCSWLSSALSVSLSKTISGAIPTS